MKPQRKIVYMILLVEDEPKSRYAVARILRRHDYEVAEAAGGNEALALLNKSHFDLIITDLKMPDQSGLVLLAHIRANWPQMPLIMMSGYLSEAAGKIVADGFSEFLRKPIDPPTLIATVRRLLA
jgi:two-component system response regulator HydG